MMQRPLPIRGLPLAPTVPGLTVMEDVRNATSSYPRKPIAPIPLSQPAASIAVAAKAVEPRTGKRQRWHGHGTNLPPQHRPRPRVTAAPAPAEIENVDRSLYPARRYRKEIPGFIPIQPQAFAPHSHPLAVRTPLDVFRFFPLTVGTAATLAGCSGLLAGFIANRALGGNLPPVWFMVGYLALFLLSLLSHYFSAKGQLFFANRRRFLRLLAANALLLLPHFIVYSVLLGISTK
jgi:hypothetical protein